MLDKKIILENKSNNQILVDMREMRLEHDGIKTKMTDLLGELEVIEKKYDQHNKILQERLKIK